MKSVNDYYYICEKGHVTVGKGKTKKKCDQKVRHIKLVKKGKAGIEKEVIKESICESKLEKIKEIPEELKLFEKWDYHTIKAFMIDQSYENLKIKFIETLQEQISTLYTMIIDTKKEVKEWKEKK